MRLLPFVLLLALAACTPTETTSSDAGPAAESEPLRVEGVEEERSDEAVRYTVSLRYPQLRPETGEAVARVNADIRARMEALAEDVRPDTTDLPADLREEDGSLPFFITGTAEGDFSEPVLEGDLLSTFFLGSVYTGGAHPNQVALPLNYDLRTGEAIAIASLFRSGTAWTDSLSALTTAVLENERGDTEWMFEGRVPPNEEVFTVFTLQPEGLLFIFPPYSIAAYAMGPSEALLPWDQLDEILDPNGPASRVRR